MAAVVRSASTDPTFSDQSHLHIPTQGFPERMGRGRSRSESRLSLPRSDSVFSLSRMRPPSAASSSGTVATHSRRQVYTVDREVLLAKAGIRTEGTPAPPTPLRLVNKTRRIVGTISLADLLVIAKGVPITGLQQARSSRAQSVTSAPQYMETDASYSREQRYSSLGALQSLGKTPWDVLGLNNGNFKSSEDLKQFLRQQSAPTSEWATGLKGKATKGRFAAGSHGCLNLTPGMVRGDSMNKSHTRSLDNVHFLDYSPTNRRSDREGAASPFSPPSHRRGMDHQDEEDFLSRLTPPNSRRGHRDDDEDADDEEDWLSLLSPSAAKSLRALDEAERPYAAHRRRKSRKHRDQDEEESPASGSSPPQQRKHLRTKRTYAADTSYHSLSAEENMVDGQRGKVTPPSARTPESLRRLPPLKMNENLSPRFTPKAAAKRTIEYGRSNSMPIPSKTDSYFGKLSPLSPASPQLHHRWPTRSNLSPAINPDFGRKLGGGFGLFDRPPSPGSPKFSPILKRPGGTPPSPRTPVTKQRRVNLKNVDAKWPSPLSPDSLRKQMMETECAETSPIEEEVTNPDFEVLLNLLISESAKLAPPVNQTSQPTDMTEGRKSPSPMICVNELEVNDSLHEVKPEPLHVIDASQEFIMNASTEEELAYQNSTHVSASRLSPIPQSGSKSPSPFSTSSHSKLELGKPPQRPPSPFSHQERSSPSPSAEFRDECRPTQIGSQENLEICDEVLKTVSDISEEVTGPSPEEGSEAQLENTIASKEVDGKEDWLSLLSPMGAKSMRALSEAERPYANLISRSKEQLNYTRSTEFDAVVNYQKTSRSPSPYSIGSLKGKRARPIRPPLPYALQMKGSKSSDLDLISKDENENALHMRYKAPKKPPRSLSQSSITSETSFESYELTPPKPMISRSPSMSSSIFGKRDRPLRPPLPLVLQASMSSNLNLQSMESDEKPTSDRFNLDTLQRENKPAVLECTLIEKAGSRSRSPSPYQPSQVPREHSPFKLLAEGKGFQGLHMTPSRLSPSSYSRESKLSPEADAHDQLSRGPSPLDLPPEQTFSLSVIQKPSSRSPSPYSNNAGVAKEGPNVSLRGSSPITSHHEQLFINDAAKKRPSHSPSPYSTSCESRKETPNRLSRDPSPRALLPRQPFLNTVSQKSNSRSESLCTPEPMQDVLNTQKWDTIPLDLPAEHLSAASQKSISRSASPYSRASGHRTETPVQQQQQTASESELLLEPTFSPNVLQNQSSRSLSQYSGSSGNRRLVASDKKASTEQITKVRSDSQTNISVSNTSVKNLPSTKEEVTQGDGIGEHENKFKIVDVESSAALKVPTAGEQRDRVESISSRTSEQTKSTRPSRPSPPPPLNLYRRSPVLLSTILPAIEKTSNEQPPNVISEEESVSQSYRFHDLYATAGKEKTDRVTYTKDDIKAILRGEKPLRPPPPVPVIRRRSSSDESSGKNNEVAQNQDTGLEAAKGITTTEEESGIGEVIEDKEKESDTLIIAAQEGATDEVGQVADTAGELPTNVTTSSAEEQGSQLRPLATMVNDTSPAEDSQPPPPLPPRVPQRRRSCISLTSNKKEHEETVKPTEEASDYAGEASLSQSYLYDVYAIAGSRRTDRVTYTKDDIKAVLRGEKPLRPPPPSLLSMRHYSITSSLESPINENEINTEADDLTVSAPATQNTPINDEYQQDQQEDDQSRNVATIGSTLEAVSSAENQNENSEAVPTKVEPPAKMEPPDMEPSVVELPAAKPSVVELPAAKPPVAEPQSTTKPQRSNSIAAKLKSVLPKRPIRPPLPQIFLSKSTSTANLVSPKERIPMNKPSVKARTPPVLNPPGSRSPSPMAFKSVRGIGNTKLPMRPPLPVNILVQQWLDKQCKPMN